MTVKIAYLVWYRWRAFPPKGKWRKIVQSAHSEIMIAKVLVKDEDEKNRFACSRK